MLTTTPMMIADVLELWPRQFRDSRGFFAETYNCEQFGARGITSQWIQDNQSYSSKRFTLRGLHYQRPPAGQAKLVRVLRGSIFDVAVDIRRDSPTFGRWVAAHLSARAFNQLLIPEGFAHGFLTLEDETEVFYKVTAPYSPEHDCSIRWDDPTFAIDWPLEGHEPLLSDKDAAAPVFKNVEVVF